MSPTPRAAVVLGAIALGALVLPAGVVALAAAALALAAVIDARSVRGAPVVTRVLPPVLSRGVPVAVTISAHVPDAAALRLRQVTPPEIRLEPGEAESEIHGRLTALARGRHVLPAVGIRAQGALGLGASFHDAGGPAELHVYPDLVAARALALAAREGRLLDSARRARGPLGLGTDFESVREWLPDDDVRHINWPATQRTGRPMTNQYRLEQARDLIFLIDSGRLMGAPVGDRTRLDAALDAVAAVALAADELGDHCGAIAFDSTVRRRVRPARAGGAKLVQALFDLQPRSVDSDYEQAFRLVAGGKRSLVLVLTDLFDDAAARSLVQAVPVISRRHAVIVASVVDPDLARLVSGAGGADPFAAAVALDLLDARARAAARLRAGGTRVLEAEPGALAGASVRAYLRAKRTLRL